MSRRPERSPLELLTRRAAYLVLGLYASLVILNAIDRTYMIPPLFNGLVPMVVGALFGPTAISLWQRRGKGGDDDGDSG